MRTGLVACLALTASLSAPGSASALGLGVSTPSVTLTAFGPGQTASGSGALLVTGVLTPWTLKVADTSGNAGHPAAAVVGCAGSEVRTVNALSVHASGVIGTTGSAGTVSIGSGSVTVASGVVADTVNVAYSLVIGQTETMRAGCVYSTTVTYTVQ